ncbi:MAG TPA: hypothetical protein VFM55_20825 [Micromonosporaceae bacterium]|nr:hypothetical protein [Micromonosporaceae bacterium]
MPHSAAEGGSAYTDWSGMGVAQIWAVLAGYQTDPQWTHVDGWRKAYQLASVHLRRMRDYREWVAAAWPPERNEAARAYLARMDEMISSVQATYDAAAANHTTVSVATAAIDTTRNRLRPVYEEWLANEEQLAAYRPPAAGAPAPSPGPAPVPSGRQEELARQARWLMVELSGALAAASYVMVTPPAYTAPRLADDGAVALPSRGGARLVPAAIPPVVPAPPVVPTASGVARPAVPGPAGPPVRSGPQVAPAGLRPGTAGTSGSPGISGSRTPPARPTPPSRSAPTPPPAPTPPRAAPAGAGRVAGVIGPVPGAGPGRPPSGGRVVPAPEGGARPMPAGGVIGGPPGIGLAQPGGHRPVPRANPVGGVLGETDTATTPGRTHPGAHVAALVGGGQTVGGVIRGRQQPGDISGAGVANQRRGDPDGGGLAHQRGGGAGAAGPGSFRTPDGHLVSISTGPTGESGQPLPEERAGRQADPDNPWETRKGVRPVVQAPPPPRRHDPGPALGLS